MILGPNDPRAITDAQRAAAIAPTAEWAKVLGIKPMTKAQKARYENQLDAVLDLIGWEDES
jgi:hypothetical protein